MIRSTRLSTPEGERYPQFLERVICIFSMLNYVSMMVNRFSNSVSKIFFLLIALILGSVCINTVSAQSFSTDKKENKSHRKKIAQRHLRDSIWQKNLNITDTSSAKAISRIQDMNSTLNDFNDVVDEGYDSTE